MIAEKVEKCGVIPVYKPAGITSHDVVAKIRRLLGIQRVGHSGTLDPMVTGVLPVLIGQATRLSDYFMGLPKKYAAVAALGSATDTQDACGSVVAAADYAHVTKEDIERCFLDFSGDIFQIPPDYSAVKIGGKKLLEYAVSGKTAPAKKARRVTVYSLRLLDFSDDLSFEVECSKGTYIRTLCHDMGIALGTYAHLKNLVRVSSGGFSAEEAVLLEDVGEESLIDIGDAARRIWNIGIINIDGLSSDISKRLKNGVKFDLSRYGDVESARVRVARAGYDVGRFAISDEYLVYCGNRLVGIADSDFRISKLIGYGA